MENAHFVVLKLQKAIGRIWGAVLSCILPWVGFKIYQIDRIHHPFPLSNGYYIVATEVLCILFPLVVTYEEISLWIIDLLSMFEVGAIGVH